MTSPISPVSFSKSVFKIQPVSKISTVQGRDPIEKVDQKPSQTQEVFFNKALGRNLNILI